MIYKAITEQCRALYEELEALTEANMRMNEHIQLNNNRKEAIKEQLEGLTEYQPVYWPDEEKSDSEVLYGSTIQSDYVTNPNQTLQDIATKFGISLSQATREINKLFTKH